MLSVSDISTYDFCKRKLFINKVLGIKEPKNVNTLKGSIIHETIEEWVATRKSPNMLLKEQIKKNHKELKKFGQGLVDFYNEALPWIKNEVELLNKYELKAEIQIIDEDLGIKGRIDLIAKGRKEVPIEIKTGNSPRENELWPSHQLQLGAYLIMLKKSEGEVHYIKDGEIRSIILNPFLERKIKNIIFEAKKLINNFNLPPTLDEENKCAKCGIREFCYNKNKVINRLEQVKRNK